MAAHKNHQQKDYKILRGVVIWLYNYQCAFCNLKTEDLETHHINKISSDNRLENIIPLCWKCHKLVHKMKIFEQVLKKQLIKLLKAKMESFL